MDAKCYNPCLVPDMGGLGAFGTPFKYLKDITRVIIANMRKIIDTGRRKKIIGPPAESDWRNDSSNKGPNTNPRIKVAIGNSSSS
jgi:hypothetical protein